VVSCKTLKPKVPAPLDRVGSPKDGIQLFGIWRFRLQNQQMLLHISQQFVRFIKKSLIKSLISMLTLSPRFG